MFTVYHSNQLDTLKILLIHLIKSEPLAHPFEAEQILVQSPGMSQWLKMALAQELGITANIDFPLPATFIWEMFARVLPDVPKRSAFNKEAMTWKLMRLLPEMLELADFMPLKQYLADEDSQLKRFQLAEKIADIFDGYLVYRPDWIECWEDGETVEALAGRHPWQAVLWKRLFDETQSLGQSHYHRGNLYQQFIEKLQHSRIQEGVLPKRLFIFGITALPPRYIDALKALGEQTDVHLMLTNPCQHYWGEIRDRKYLARMASLKRKQIVLQGEQLVTGAERSPLKGSIEENLTDELHLRQAVGNSLLASMGKLGRDNLYLLSQTESEEHEFFIDTPRDTLLHQIQADILHLEEHQNDQILTSSTHKQAVRPDDNSLSIHQCHSPLREVEVLHDELLALFDDIPDLKPRDVIVMVADINTYSPAIEAVFGNASTERYIPFSISDRTADQETPVLQAFMRLLQLPRSRCLASELLELLETPTMLARFEMNDADFLQAKSWVEASGIRWGLNEQTAGEFGLPKTRQNTWEFGIERMLAGYAMSDTAMLLELDNRSVAPYNEIQGLDAELAGKLAAFISRIRDYREKLNQTLPVAEWRVLLNDLLDDFFAVSVEEEVSFQQIRDTLTHLQEQLQDARYDAPIAPDILYHYLSGQLSNARVSQRFLAGQVNFCTLMPMRSIPFRIVCLLGMNDGVYPRSVPAEGFDLMTEQSRPGDRSRRDDDRYLFLEALLSARERLYISYVGRSVQDNSISLPSVLVSELVEYCHQNYCLDGDAELACDDSGDRLIRQLTFSHPMVPYSPDAFSSGHGSYAREWLPVASGAAPEPQPQITESSRLPDFLDDVTFPLELDFVELQRFWRLPVQYFFNRRLRVWFENELVSVHDEEPFSLSGLERYQLLDELVETLLEVRGQNSPALDQNAEEQQIEHFVRAKRAQGLLPVGAFGELEFRQNYEQAIALVDVIAGLCCQPQPDREINIRTEVLGAGQPIQLLGWVTNCFAAGLVRYRVGRIRAQDYLSAWLDHLVMAVAGESCPTHVIGYEQKAGVRHLFYPPIEQAQAQSCLDELVRLYIQGMNYPLAYFPRTALAGIEAGFNRQGEWHEDQDKADKKMREAFVGSDFSAVGGEGQNAYIGRIWPLWSDKLSQDVRLHTALILQAPRLWIKEYTDV
ncbi:exodeoxyribonuclease V subunit gamma [Vibrio mangrovi]|uniref:RecBCD enzyme subunit RecC n=1 Tax=Vibrio mangrovi TaxID=474394 RepID=A0A1Y6IRL7_9VIBR|nr:exodeoxyribonuclease V subunit gamma [Vibrio mangrovi]MDW6001676.1 exodeoxyribonuclease V subunit gamma [Vibrio mangrovi]SMS00297.1 RecBCD enzyme subunit RecC [Vibrio mangrovi]